MHAGKFEFCDEFYAVEKTVEVVVRIRGEGQQIRIEALRDLRAGDSPYRTRAYRLQHVRLQPTYGGGGPVETQLWLDYDLPWTSRDSADGAIAQALGFLRERCGER